MDPPAALTYCHAGPVRRREEVRVLDTPWSAALLAVLSLSTAAVFAVEPARRSGERTVLAVHALMGVAMAGMFSPWGDPVPPLAGAVVFGVVAAWFVALRLNRGGTGVDATTHTAVASVAMVVMYLWHQPAGTPDAAAGGSGHAHHAAGATGSAGALVVVASLLLGAYFVWHAWMCARQIEDAAPDSDVRVRTRVEPVAHLAMSALMAVMFLGAL
jgi:small neutral amino acid transporter SnatA (MarC family)